MAKELRFNIDEESINEKWLHSMRRKESRKQTEDDFESVELSKD